MLWCPQPVTQSAALGRYPKFADNVVMRAGMSAVGTGRGPEADSDIDGGKARHIRFRPALFARYKAWSARWTTALASSSPTTAAATPILTVIAFASGPTLMFARSC